MSDGSAVPADGDDRPTIRRMRPSDRRAEIVKAARTVFLASGYDGVGLAEVATVGDVSRGSLYRYFPNGRVDLFLAVTEDLVDELHGRLRYAAGAPFSASTRMEQLIAAMFAYFQDEPQAYRLLFRDVWSAGDPAVEAVASTTRAMVTGEISGLLADSGASSDELAAAAAGIFGFTAATIELALAGEVDAETAWSVSCRYATAQLGG
ncbi:MAG: TetR/AcrR family transcriptional regulator [Acidimicrobiales bacterium]